MKKKFTKEEWVKLLKRDLVKVPTHNGSESYEYTTPENLIVTITTKTKIRRNYTFGGPVWCATVNFFDKDKLTVDFLSSLKKSYHIAWVKINEIDFRFISI